MARHIINILGVDANGILSDFKYFSKTGNITHQLKLFFESLEYNNSYDALMILDYVEEVTRL